MMIMEKTLNDNMEKFFSIAFYSHFLIANNFLQKNLKTQADSFFFFLAQYEYLRVYKYWNFYATINKILRVPVSSKNLF